MDVSSYNDILDDETLAPLKRNHACHQCKKRKVKCDAVGLEPLNPPSQVLSNVFSNLDPTHLLPLSPIPRSCTSFGTALEI